MLKYVFAIGMVMGTLTTHAQELHLLRDSLSTFGIEAQGGIGSKSITVPFVQSFFNGGSLSRKVRQTVLDNISEADNYVGAGANARIFYHQKLGNGMLCFDVGSYQYFDARFSKDLYQLTFFGNKSFEGKTANLHPFYVMEMQYRAYKLGWRNRWRGIQWGIHLGLLQGLSYNRIKTTEGSLFTANQGEFIDIRLKMNHEQAEASNTWKGTGFAGDFFLKFDLGTKTKIGLGVEQLGFITWSDDSKLRVVDSSYHFEGVEVGGLLDSIFVDVKSFDQLTEDWIETTALKQFQTRVPFQFKLQLNHQLSKRLSIGLDGWVMPLESFKPRVGLELDYKVFNWTLLGLTAHYGGFSVFDAGLLYEQKWPLKIVTSVKASMSFDQLNSKGVGAYVGAGVYKTFGR